MPATVQTLRTLFPELSVNDHPDATVEAWLAVAVQMINEAKWGTLTDHGVHLLTAHNLIVNRVKPGAAPGQVRGVQSSKSADGLSISIDVSSVMEEGAGYYNATTYGQQYYRMARMMGAGPVQIGTPKASDLRGGAWPGVIMFPN